MIFLDDDDLPDRGWLEAFAAVLQEGHAAVVCCGLRVVHEINGTAVETMLPTKVDVALGDGRGLFLPGTFSVRKDVFDASGGFAVGLEASHQTEYSWRLLPLCAANGWSVEAIDRPLISLLRRPPNDRAEVSPAKLLQGVTYLLDEHARYLETRLRVRAQYEAIAGVAAARLGDYRAARHLLRRAIRDDPKNVRHLARYAMSCVSPVGRRVWGDVSAHVDSTREVDPNSSVGDGVSG